MFLWVHQRSGVTLDQTLFLWDLQVSFQAHVIVLFCNQLSCLKWSFSRYSRGMSCSSSLPLRRKRLRQFCKHAWKVETLPKEKNHFGEQSWRNWGGYLRWSSEIDDTIQLNVLAKLAVQPAVPVLVHGPFCLIHARVLIEISCKDVPEKQVETKRKGSAFSLQAACPHYCQRRRDGLAKDLNLSAASRQQIYIYKQIYRLFSSVIDDTCHCRWSAQRTARDSQPLAASR